MNIRQIRDMLSKSGIEQNEAQKEAEMFVEHFLKLDSVKLAINPEFSETSELMNGIKTRCETHVPIQHIFGQAYFMGEYFYVTKNTLIPRDETEILTGKAIEVIKKNDLKKVLDIGTGTGCIACIIAKETNAQVLGVDISSETLQVALDNTSKLNLFNKAIFRKSDLFSNIHADEKFDIIVSNPPYIPLSEKENLQKEVRFEPDSALFALDKDGVEFYQKITEQAPEYLNKNGYLMFELGIGQSEQVKSFMEKNGFCDIEIIKDLAYIDRVIMGRKI